ncbi:MAG: hypothetical protein KAY24_15505 [Candidatus Eisenbacteria sp.]|nr:hypothetical protein [Candidatus Eisenbacteria bacterium]
MRNYLTLVLVGLVLFGTAPAMGVAISNIQFDPSSAAALKWNVHVDVTFDYSVDVADGVRIYPRPISHGSTTPNYAASGSPLYVPGSGSGSGYFTITSGEALVDDVRFQVYNHDNTVLLLEFYVPVSFYFGAHAIYNIELNPATPSCVIFQQQDVNIAFDYATDYPDGVRIFARPYTGSGLTPGYSASGSPVHPTGTGSGTQYFHINPGPEVTVDKIRFQMVNPSQTEMLLEFFIPVDYEFKDGSVYNVSFSPDWPAGLLNSEDVTVMFDYQTTEVTGVRIFARPMTNGGLTPGYAASGSPLYPTGTGSGSGTFRIQSGEQTIDAVRFKMTNADQTQEIMECYVPVNYHYAGDIVRRIQLEHPSPAYFTLEHHADMVLPYFTGEPNGVRIWGLPYTHGSYTPGGAYAPSPVWPVGVGNATSFVSVQNSPAVVDEIYLLMTNADQSVTLMEWFVPARLKFGNQLPSAVEPAREDPVRVAMFAHFRNPLSVGSTVRYTLPADADVTLRVYDIQGRSEALLVNGHQGAGDHEVAFEGAGLGHGIYFLRLEASQDGSSEGLLVDTRKVVLLP